MSPVPPYKTPTDVVALTNPLLAWSGPLREPASVSAPVEPKEEVAVAPKRAEENAPRFAKKELVEVAFVSVAFVVMRPPLKLRSVVVAFDGKR